MISPWLRWVGGKRALAPRLVEEITATSPALYVEPFLGGGAVALSLPSGVSRVLADLNPSLVECWRSIRQYPTPLITQLRTLEERYGNHQEGYLLARDQFNRLARAPRALWIERAAHFMYLNAHCFNGLWRVNAQGDFNVSFGSIAKPRRVSLDDAHAASRLLAYADLRCCSFEQVLSEVSTRRLSSGRASPLRGVAIYADPPYDGTFQGYSAQGFDEDRQALLASTLRDWASWGASVWASNSDTPLVRSLYQWASVEAIHETHLVGATPDRRGLRGCVLIRAGDARA